MPQRDCFFFRFIIDSIIIFDDLFRIDELINHNHTTENLLEIFRFLRGNVDFRRKHVLDSFAPSIILNFMVLNFYFGQ